MTTNKYLEMLRAEKSQKGLGQELSKSSKLNFEDFEGAKGRHISDFSPPLGADGVPCGPCPSCGKGEFWRWPKYHKDHDPRGWTCWFCLPPPHGSGPCDFCGVPGPRDNDPCTHRTFNLGFFKAEFEPNHPEDIGGRENPQPQSTLLRTARNSHAR